MQLFLPFRELIIDKPISHTWRGVGSAIFLELGDLTPHQLTSGIPGEPDGETSIMIPWSWRVETTRSILGGSWSGERKISNIVKSLRGHTIIKAELFCRLPELHLTLSNGLHILSFMTSESQPDWAIISRTLSKSLCVKRGKLVIEAHDT